MKNNTEQTKLCYSLYASMAALYFNGLLYAVWGVNIPVVQEKFDLSEGSLSVALAAVAVGGIATMARASRFITRTGSRFSSVLSGTLMALSGAAILFIPAFVPLLVLLAIFGMFVAAHDISVNTQVTSLERLSGRSMIGALHGSFSAGGLSGALLSSAWQETSLSQAANFYLPALLAAAVMLLTFRFMVPHQDEQASESDTPAGIECPPGVSQKQARRRLVFLGTLAFSALVIEGAVYDWAAVYMRQVVQAPSSWIGYGYAAFAIGLVTGRLSGDKLRARMAHQRIIAAGWVVAMAGLACVLLLSAPAGVVVGFFMTGLGISNIIPLLFSSAAKLATGAGIPASEGLAVTTRIGYVGLLAGPLLVGPVASAVGLRLSLLSLSVALTFTCAGWLLLSRHTDGKPWVMSVGRS